MREADENPYADLSDDNQLAFMQLEAEFRDNFETLLEEPNTNFDYIASDYMNKVVAAAKALEIEALASYEVPLSSYTDFSNLFAVFQKDVDNVIVQMRIHHARRRRRLSVGLSPENKARIQALISKIRSQIEHSDAAPDKKHKLYSILGDLAKEVDRDRTRLEYFGDLARGLAAISTEVAQEGAEPWWKWFKAIMGVVDKEKEQETLPAPPEVKRIEPPRKALPKSSGTSTAEPDEIPF